MTVKDEMAEEPREEGGVRRPRRRSRDTDKVSTSDTKSLKLDLLETSLLPLQIKDWYKNGIIIKSPQVGAMETITELNWPASERSSAIKFA